MNVLRLAPVLLLALTLPAVPALARERGTSVSMNSSCCDEPSRWSDRHAPADRRFEIITENGKVALLLTREVVALQLSDRTMHKVDRELRSKEREHRDQPLADAIAGAVIGSVRALLDHSAECDLRDVRSVDYRGGRLVFIANDGSRLFERLEIDDDRVLEGFSERDAAQFIREFRLAKSRAR